MKTVETVIERLIEMGMQVNPRKITWATDKVDYLGVTITRDGIKPQKEKIQAILKIKEPENQKQVRHFVGLVNFYKRFYKERSKTLGPIYELTGKNVKFKWTKECQEVFTKMKAIIAEDAIVSLPQYGKEFIVHTDASDVQIGGIISQSDRILAYFSRKFNKAQSLYPITEKELLAIVETLKAFRTILLGQKITVYTLIIKI